MKVSFLEWDSVFFNKRIFRIDLVKRLDFLDDIEERLPLEYDICYLFAQNKIIQSPNFNLKLVDTKVVYCKSVGNEIHVDSHITSFKGSISQELLELAELSGQYSRFRLDPWINQEFGRLYATWLKRSISRDIADEVFVYNDNESINGFVTVKRANRIATIGLISVNTLSQGNGIGSKLIAAVESWCSKNNIEEIHVATQEANRQACSFYSKYGFKEQAKSYIYHLHKKDDTI